MPDPCYTLDEILQLAGDEAHLSRCGKCRALYERKNRLDDLLAGELRVLGRLQAERGERSRAAELLGTLKALPPAARFPFLATERALTRAMILVLCEHAKEYHLRSPNRAEEWLNLAIQIANHLEQQPRRDQRDFQWTLGKLALAQSNLSMSRGHLQAYHRQVTRAVEFFQAVPDEFQQAVAARGLLFSLAKMGRPGKAILTALESLPVLRAYGAARERSWLWINLSLVLLADGRRERAARVLELLLHSLPPEDPHYPLVLHNQVLVFLERRDSGRAREALARLRGVVNSRGLRLEEARTHIMEGEINLLQERADDALTALSLARRLLPGENAAYDLALIALYEALAHTLKDESATGLERLHDAIRFFSTEGFSGDLVRALEVWEQALVNGGNVSRRASCAAFDTFRNLSRPVPTTLYA